MGRKGKTIIIGLGAISLVAVVAILWARRKKANAQAPMPSIDLSKFDSPDVPGSGKCMDKQFLDMLSSLEKETGYPIFKNINSGARSEAWNRKVGGVKTSAHKIPTCKAADIHAPTLEIQKKLAKGARKVGFNRIGIGKTFVHLDNDETKPQNVAWGYPYGTKPPFNPFG